MMPLCLLSNLEREHGNSAKFLPTLTPKSLLPFNTDILSRSFLCFGEHIESKEETSKHLLFIQNVPFNLGRRCSPCRNN